MIKTILERICLWLCIFSLWYIGSIYNWWSSFIVPPPQRVVQTGTLLLQSSIFWHHIGASISRVLEGFSLAFLFAVPLGIGLGISRRLYRITTPVLEFFRHVPPLALLPMIILWCGIGELSKLTIVILATFFPIFLNTLTGIQQYDPKLEEVSKAFGIPKATHFRTVRLPQALPYIWVGLRLGLGYSWRSLIGAEMIAASSGIGYMILDGEEMARPDIVVIGIFTIGITGILFDSALQYLGKRGLPFMKEERPHG